MCFLYQDSNIFIDVTGGFNHADSTQFQIRVSYLFSIRKKYYGRFLSFNDLNQLISYKGKLQ